MKFRKERTRFVLNKGMIASTLCAFLSSDSKLFECYAAILEKQRNYKEIIDKLKYI